MATKTLILRPTSVTSDDDSLVTLYPSGTSMTSAHMLVGEETADEDATYITGGLGSNIHFHFTFSKPSDLKNIIGFSFTVRNKYEASSSNHNISYNLYINSNSYTLCSLTGNPTIYTDMSSSITSEIQNEIIGLLNNGDLEFFVTQAAGTGSKGKPIRTTQMYIIITYESNDAVLQYFKQNDQWTNIGELTIYYKNSDEWTLLNDAQIELYINDEKYLIEVI